MGFKDFLKRPGIGLIIDAVKSAANGDKRVEERVNEQRDERDKNQEIYKKQSAKIEQTLSSIKRDLESGNRQLVQDAIETLENILQGYAGKISNAQERRAKVLFSVAKAREKTLRLAEKYKPAHKKTWGFGDESNGW